MLNFGSATYCDFKGRDLKVFSYHHDANVTLPLSLSLFFLIIAILTAVKWYIVVLISIFLMISDVDVIFDHLYIFVREVPNQVNCPFFNKLLVICC